LRVAKKDSATALSKHDPVRPMERRSPSRSQASMQAVEVYSLGSRGRGNTALLEQQ
jgi:hypothetical protein